MANVLIESQTMTGIANAIREKNGTENTYLPADMPQAIKDIQSEDTGVGSRQWWLDVCKEKTNFYYMFTGLQKLTTVPYFDTSNGTYFCNMFENCISLIEIPQFDTSSGIYFNYMFAYCKSLTEVPRLDTSRGVTFISMFNDCRKLVSIGTMNLSSATNCASTFNACYSLENVSFIPECIKASVGFPHSKFLTDESIQSIIDGLATVTNAQTLTLHAEVKAKLTDEQIAQITSKNWTLA